MSLPELIADIKASIALIEEPLPGLLYADDVRPVLKAILRILEATEAEKHAKNDD